MTDDPDNRRPRWPNFKQTEEFYNITIFFFNTSKFTAEVKNLADIQYFMKWGHYFLDKQYIKYSKLLYKMGNYTS